MQNKRIIIIGNGIAGLSAAESVRKKDQTVEIVIISNDKYLTYYRTRISELFKGDADYNSLIMRKEEWYKEREIELLLGKKVTRIDSDKKLIVFCDNESIGENELKYDKLIITAGARCFVPDIPGVKSHNVQILRTIEDAKRIADKLQNIKHAVVVGGGLLGLECAYDFNKKGIKTNVIEFKDRLLPNQLDEEGSEIFEDKVISLGINVIKGVALDEIKDINDNEDGRGNSDRKKIVVLSNGQQIKTDLILFSAGACPNKEIVNGTDIKTSHAIIVDKYMHTNIKDIFSAGDAAEFKGKWYGLWSVALNQGRVAGNNAVESDELLEYNPQIPPYFLNSMGVRVSSIGDIGKNPAVVYETEKNIDKQNHIYQKLYFTDRRIVGSILVGDSKKATALGRAIESGLSKEEVEKTI
jgi:nitrite reductase (NADH) large subunit